MNRTPRSAAPGVSRRAALLAPIMAGALMVAASGPALASGTVAGQAPAALSDDAFDREVKSLGAEIGALESRSAEF